MKRILAGAALMAVAVTGGAVATTPPAYAGEFGQTIYEFCPPNKYIRMKLVITKDWVRIGYGRQQRDAALGQTYATFKPGTRYLYMDLNAGWWIEWNSPGHLVSAVRECVNYT